MMQDVNDTVHYAAADCDGAGDTGCGAVGIWIENDAGGNANKHKAVISDNLIIGPFTSTLGTLRGVWALTGATMDFNADIDHNTIDGRGSSINGGIDISAASNPIIPITVNMRDNAGWHFNSGATGVGMMVSCSNQTNVLDLFGNSYVSNGLANTEIVGLGSVPGLRARHRGLKLGSIHRVAFRIEVLLPESCHRTITGLSAVQL